MENQQYPNLLDEKGNPIPPYDVTANTLSLLMGVKVSRIYRPFVWKLPNSGSGFGRGCGSGSGGGSGFTKPLPANVIYRSSVPSIDEGWTRWVAERQYAIDCKLPFESTTDIEIRSGKFARRSVIFPDQSPNQILNGYAKGSMPDEYTGGVGKEGVENLKKFVEAGGTLIFLNRASDFAIEQFNLPIKDVTKGLARKDFYIRGSILGTELDTTNPIAKGMPKESIAWFEGGPAFELSEPPASVGGQSAGANWPPANAGGSDIRIIARYPSDPTKILLSGWALGAEKIAGKAALIEVKIGKGKIILFGFRPQYRGQSLATFPLLFNAISQ